MLCGVPFGSDKPCAIHTTGRPSRSSPYSPPGVYLHTSGKHPRKRASAPRLLHHSVHTASTTTQCAPGSYGATVCTRRIWVHVGCRIVCSLSTHCTHACAGRQAGRQALGVDVGQPQNILRGAPTQHSLGVVAIFRHRFFGPTVHLYRLRHKHRGSRTTALAARAAWMHGRIHKTRGKRTCDARARVRWVG